MASRAWGQPRLQGVPAKCPHSVTRLPARAVANILCAWGQVTGQPSHKRLPATSAPLGAAMAYLPNQGREKGGMRHPSLGASGCTCTCRLHTGCREREATARSHKNAVTTRVCPGTVQTGPAICKECPMLRGTIPFLGTGPSCQG